MSKFQTFYEIVNLNLVILTIFLQEIWPLFGLFHFWGFGLLWNCLWPNMAFLIFLDLATLSLPVSPLSLSFFSLPPLSLLSVDLSLSISLPSLFLLSVFLSPLPCLSISSNLCSVSLLYPVSLVYLFSLSISLFTLSPSFAIPLWVSSYTHARTHTHIFYLNFFESFWLIRVLVAVCKNM